MVASGFIKPKSKKKLFLIFDLKLSITTKNIKPAQPLRNNLYTEIIYCETRMALAPVG